MDSKNNTRSARILKLCNITSEIANSDDNNNEFSSPAPSIGASLSSSDRKWWDDLLHSNSGNSNYLDDLDASTEKPLPAKRAKRQLLYPPSENLDPTHAETTFHQLQVLAVTNQEYPIVNLDSFDTMGVLPNDEENPLPVLPEISDNDGTVQIVTGKEPSTLFVTPSSSASGLPGTPQTSGGSRRRRSRGTPSDSSSRKRSRNPVKWKSNIAKLARDSGEEYTSVKGKKVNARVMGAACVNCKYKCNSRVDEDHRKAIFTQFWGIKNHNRQWDFIARHTKITDKKTCTTNWESRRNFSRYYFFRIEGQEARVCKTMFIQTLGISDMWIRTAANKLGIGGSVSPDKRGKSKKTSRLICDTTKQSVGDHINSMEKVPSHYCRARSNTEYLPAGLTIRKLHALYVEWFSNQTYDATVKLATERQYRDIFNTQFNISFFIPKKDQCDQCTKYKNSNPEMQQCLQKDHDTHMRNKEAVRNLKDQDKKDAKSNKELCVACFDLEKVLNVPHGETSGFYYKSKLSVFNFTVFDLGICEGHAYVWHEAIAKRGSNEVGSCLLNYITTKVEKGVKEFKFYCDNCCGQNKNRYIYSMFLHLAAKYNISITLRFLEVGHTQSEGDSMHALIERRAKRREIYTSDEWMTLIKLAKDGPRPYIVHEVTQNDIFDLKVLLEGQNWGKDEENRVITWSQLREVHVTGSAPNMLHFKYNYADEYSCMCTKARVGSPVNVAKISLKQAYDEKIPLGENLLKGLADLCVRQLIPSNRHDFFKGLCADNGVPWPNPPKSKPRSK